MKYGRVLLLFCVFLVACGQSDPATERAEQAATATGPIVVGVAWPLSTAKGTLANGVKMAVNDINNHGGVLGRKIKVIMKDDKLSVSKGLIIAQQFANNPNMIAVIGHLNSYISIPASAVYQFAGLVMISPGSSGQRLTHQGFNLVFRTIPNDKSQGRQLAEYAAKRHYKKVIIYYIKNAYGLDLANYFEKRAEALGIDVVDRRSYDKASRNYRQVLQDWQSLYNFDAIFLAGSLPESADIIREMRSVGIKVPVFGGAGLDSTQLIKLGGKPVEGTVVTSFFAPDAPNPMVRKFDAGYEARYGELPDSSAAGGYDAINLLAYAITKAHSTVPAKIAYVLHHTVGWVGVTGVHTFNKNGDVVNKKIVLKIVRNGKFHYLPMKDVRPAAHPVTSQVDN